MHVDRASAEIVRWDDVFISWERNRYVDRDGISPIDKRVSVVPHLRAKFHPAVIVTVRNFALLDTPNVPLERSWWRK